MTSAMDRNPCVESERVCAYAIDALPPSEAAAVQSHLVSCPHCREELAALRPIVQRFVAWPADILRPPASLQQRLAQRIAAGTAAKPEPVPPRQWKEPDWDEV